jgi:hypothetical protein
VAGDLHAADPSRVSPTPSMTCSWITGQRTLLRLVIRQVTVACGRHRQVAITPAWESMPAHSEVLDELVADSPLLVTDPTR